VPKGLGISLDRVSVLRLPKGKEIGYVVFRRRHREAMWLQYDAGRAYMPALFLE
jgi:hypothetical protein